MKLERIEKLREQIIAGQSAKEIKENWKKGLIEFKKAREQYLLYK